MVNQGEKCFLVLIQNPQGKWQVFSLVQSVLEEDLSDPGV